MEMKLCTVVKKECVGHVEKRMGTRLPNIKKNNKDINISDISDKMIDELMIYYCLAIRHPDSAEYMKKEI